MSMLQRRFIDGLFDPALKQFLRLHARTDDFVTTVAKVRQYMDAQEQAKITAISKKPNDRFAAVEDPQPDRIQPIHDGRQKVHKQSWTISSECWRTSIRKRRIQERQR